MANEKLVELIAQSRVTITSDSACINGSEYIADHLIANGVTVQEWISVKDRLPNVDEVCLLSMESRTTKYRWVALGYFHTKYSAAYVTHWMPLPEPAKGVS